MKDYDVFVAALVKKVVLDSKKGIFLYQVVDIMDDGEMDLVYILDDEKIDFTNDVFIHNKTGEVYSSMESEEGMFSESDYFYAFPIRKQDLESKYPLLDTYEEKLQAYYQDLNRYVYFSAFDSNIGGIKIVQLAKEAISKMEIEADMKDFAVLYEKGFMKDLVLLPVSNIEIILQHIKEKNLKGLESYFTFLKDNTAHEIEEMKDKSEKASLLLDLDAGGTKKEEKKENAVDLSLQSSKTESTKPFYQPISVLPTFEKIKKTVIGQDEAIKKILAAIHTSDLADLTHDSSYLPRCLIVGKTGSGKTEIFKTFEKITDRPFVRTDSTQITIAGYVGGSIESNVILPLLMQAKGNVELAQRGIVYLDEIDKKGSSKNEDVAGRGVLNSFLPFLDGTQYPVTFDGRQIMFDTSSLHVFAGGAFSNIFDFHSQKMRQIGFSISKEETVHKKEITLQDFIKIGLMPDEFMGRFSSHVFMNELGVNHFETILTTSTSSPLLFYEKLFYEHYHIVLKYYDNFIKLAAQKAYAQKLGARALHGMMEEVLEACKWEIYAHDIRGKELILTEKTLENPKEFILK